MDNVISLNCFVAKKEQELKEKEKDEYDELYNFISEIIGFVHKKLGELEEFVNKSKLKVKSLKRIGPDNFIVEVAAEEDWKI